MLCLTPHSHFRISKCIEQSWVVCSIPKSVEAVKVWLPVLVPRKIFSVISTGSEQPHSGHESSVAEGPFPGKRRVVCPEVAQRRQLQGCCQWKVCKSQLSVFCLFSNLTCPSSSAKSWWGKNVNTENIVSWHDSSSFCANLNSFPSYLVHLFHVLKNEHFLFLHCI